MPSYPYKGYFIQERHSTTFHGEPTVSFDVRGVGAYESLRDAKLGIDEDIEENGAQYQEIRDPRRWPKEADRCPKCPP